MAPGNPAIQLFRLHYLDSGTLDWDERRVSRLAGMLRLTLPELAALLAMRDSEFMKHVEMASFPGPACILMTILERWYDEMILGAAPRPVFPKLDLKNDPHR